MATARELHHAHRGRKEERERGEQNLESMAKKTLSREKSTTKGKTEVGEEPPSPLLLKGESKGLTIGIQGGGSRAPSTGTAPPASPSASCGALSAAARHRSPAGQQKLPIIF